MKKLILAMFTAIMIVSLCGCRYRSEETSYTEELQDQIHNTQGFPNTNNFFEYSQLKEIYEMRDNPNLICYWYTKNDMSGKWVYQGPCIGYGIPYGASITAPESLRYQNGYAERLPLAEPNGLYTENISTSATWILALDLENNIKPVYVESEITVSQSKLESYLCEDWSIPEDY